MLREKRPRFIGGTVSRTIGKKSIESSRFKREREKNSRSIGKPFIKGVLIVLVFMLVILVTGEIFIEKADCTTYSVIEGRVISADTGEGIPNVSVDLHMFFHDSPRDYYVLTDKDGYFSFRNIKPGDYTINYYPLYPYAVDPYNDIELYDEDRAFVLRAGEVKKVIKKLKKGWAISEIRKKMKKEILDEYKGEFVFFSMIDKGEEITPVYTYDWVINPKIKDSKYAREGLKPGKYVYCLGVVQKKKYWKDNRIIHYTGNFLIFEAKEEEKKKIEFDFEGYDSEVEIVGIDKSGNELIWGEIAIYKYEKIKGKEYWIKVGEYKIGEYDNFKNVLRMKPGRYLVAIFGNTKENKLLFGTYKEFDIKKGKQKYIIRVTKELTNFEAFKKYKKIG